MVTGGSASSAIASVMLVVLVGSVVSASVMTCSVAAGSASAGSASVSSTSAGSTCLGSALVGSISVGPLSVGSVVMGSALIDSEPVADGSLVSTTVSLVLVVAGSSGEISMDISIEVITPDDSSLSLPVVSIISSATSPFVGASSKTHGCQNWTLPASEVVVLAGV
ncbi:MAG: hypothetical protein JOS17DRAFT_370087 [Linnemannia elongata]|nr:MAG: hypothetical protein JOS17DRAFT_370087 [Linnemannia elongata]